MKINYNKRESLSNRDITGKYLYVTHYNEAEGLGREYYKIGEVFRVHNWQLSEIKGVEYWVYKTAGQEISIKSCRLATQKEIEEYENKIQDR